MFGMVVIAEEVRVVSFRFRCSLVNMELQGNSQTQSSKILSTTRGSCHARHVSLLCSEAYSAELRE
ncbi:unnamed protein product [Brugia timori]|uniref:Uncharacterized protein n=1 Tax=Brugia timori TaxID=42155 RepID=A0A0R3Q7T2_9BILA|nr:unnamed protein product [Brugia timori]